MSKPTAGKVRKEPRGNGWMIFNAEGTAGIAGAIPHPHEYGVEYPEEVAANAALIEAAWNAAVEINPDNPIAAAKAMPEVILELRNIALHCKDCNPEDYRDWARSRARHTLRQVLGEEWESRLTEIDAAIKAAKGVQS